MAARGHQGVHAAVAVDAPAAAVVTVADTAAARWLLCVSRWRGVWRDLDQDLRPRSLPGFNTRI